MEETKKLTPKELENLRKAQDELKKAFNEKSKESKCPFCSTPCGNDHCAYSS